MINLRQTIPNCSLVIMALVTAKSSFKKHGVFTDLFDVFFIKKFLFLGNCQTYLLFQYFKQDSEGRMLSEMFLELPDKKEYPDYYKVILNPIDMEMICERIERNHYMTEMDFIHDFEILFQNARHFNEEDSEVYEDSIILEKALKKKRRWLSHVTGSFLSPFCLFVCLCLAYGMFILKKN